MTAVLTPAPAPRRGSRVNVFAKWMAESSKETRDRLTVMANLHAAGKRHRG
jgi:hypothetical protein